MPYKSISGGAINSTIKEAAFTSFHFQLEMHNMVFFGLVTDPFYRWADAQSIWEHLLWKYVNPSIDFEAKRILHLIIQLVSPLRIFLIGQLVPTFRICLSMDRILAFESLLAVKQKPKGHSK